MPKSDFTKEELKEIASNARSVLTSDHVGLHRGHNVESCPIEHFLCVDDDDEMHREAALNQSILRKAEALMKGMK